MQVPNFGERLDELLKARGMTQAILAEKMGIHPNHISRVKTGKGEIPEKFMRKLCNALNIPVEEFVGGNSQSLEYYPVPLREAGGGMGGGYHTGSKRVQSYVSLRRDFLLTKTSNLEALSFIHASGESMFPTIPPDAAVLIDESQVDPVNGKIFYVLLNDSYLIKRLEVREGGVIALISDNGNRRDELADDDSFQILGRAILQQTLL